MAGAAAEKYVSDAPVAHAYNRVTELDALNQQTASVRIRDAEVQARLQTGEAYLYTVDADRRAEMIRQQAQLRSDDAGQRVQMAALAASLDVNDALRRSDLRGQEAELRVQSAVAAAEARQAIAEANYASRSERQRNEILQEKITSMQAMIEKLQKERDPLDEKERVASAGCTQTEVSLAHLKEANAGLKAENALLKRAALQKGLAKRSKPTSPVRSSPHDSETSSVSEASVPVGIALRRRLNRESNKPLTPPVSPHLLERQRPQRTPTAPPMAPPSPAHSVTSWSPPRFERPVEGSAVFGGVPPPTGRFRSAFGPQSGVPPMRVPQPEPQRGVFAAASQAPRGGFAHGFSSGPNFPPPQRWSDGEDVEAEPGLQFAPIGRWRHGMTNDLPAGSRPSTDIIGEVGTYPMFIRTIAASTPGAAIAQLVGTIKHEPNFNVRRMQRILTYYGDLIKNPSRDSFELLGWELYYLFRENLVLSGRPNSFNLNEYRRLVYGDQLQDPAAALVERCTTAPTTTHYRAIAQQTTFRKRSKRQRAGFQESVTGTLAVRSRDPLPGRRAQVSGTRVVPEQKQRQSGRCRGEAPGLPVPREEDAIDGVIRFLQSQKSATVASPPLWKSAVRVVPKPLTTPEKASSNPFAKVMDFLHSSSEEVARVSRPAPRMRQRKEALKSPKEARQHSVAFRPPAQVEQVENHVMADGLAAAVTAEPINVAQFRDPELQKLAAAANA
ncbi:hypothetical protein ABB37_08041, partial [Leptomonas pyrrhocoris]